VPQEGAAPPWLLPIQQQLNQIQEQLNAANGRLDAANERLDATNERLEVIERRLRRVEINSAIAYNVNNHDGSLVAFIVVPFNDGTDPTAPPVRLSLILIQRCLIHPIAQPPGAYLKQGYQWTHAPAAGGLPTGLR
jgi:hypothetical protein